MSASYPNAVKAFSSKIDTIDTVYADHINSVQTEVTAIESVLGPNPQGQYQTVSARIGAVESSSLGEVIPNRRTFSGDRVTVNNILRVDNDPAGKITGTNSLNHPVQVGPSGAGNLIMDAGAIQARSNDAPADLHLQPFGGDVYAGPGKVWTANNQGAGSGLDADTVDGKQASDFALAGHSHVKDVLEVRGTAPKTGGFRNWTTVHYDQVTRQTGPGLTYDSATGEFVIPRTSGLGVYVLQVSFAVRTINSWYYWYYYHYYTPTFALRIIDNTDTVIDRQDFGPSRGDGYGFEYAEEFYQASLSTNGTYLIDPASAPGEADYRIRFQYIHNSSYPYLQFGPSALGRPMSASAFLLSKVVL